MELATAGCSQTDPEPLKKRVPDPQQSRRRRNRNRCDLQPDGTAL